jgi:hypothetical protein
MPKQAIIAPASVSGVDMRANPLLLGYRKFSQSKNLKYDEGTVRTRSGIRYHNLGLKGTWQGSTLFRPSSGLSSESYSEMPDGLVNIVDGVVTISVFDGCDFKPHHKIGSVGSVGPITPFEAENYLIIPGKKSHYSDGGLRLTCSKGLGDCWTETHDTLSFDDARNHLPHDAFLGAYVHGRTHVAIPYSCNSTELAVSDLISKRGCKTSDDLLVFEEHMNPSHGGGLTAPSRLGAMKALAVMPATDFNGEGELFAFHERGIVKHNTIYGQRETRHSAKGERITEGWDTRRITSVALNVIGATGRYAVHDLPNDIVFRSRFGVHFLKSVLGQGTFNDETTNTISQDVEPLMKDLSMAENCTVGHWIEGNRVLCTIGDNRSFVVFNQTNSYTEDRTPRFVTEGVWSPDEGIAKIHKFISAGGFTYGFICEDVNQNIYYAEFDDSLNSGVDIRDGKAYSIDWELNTGAFAMTEGFSSRKEIKSGYLDAVVSGEGLSVSFKTDQNNCWTKWEDISCKGLDKLLTGHQIKKPSEKDREGTWFQFKFQGSGYVDVMSFELEYSETDRKSDGKGKCITICRSDEFVV